MKEAQQARNDSEASPLRFYQERDGRVTASLQGVPGWLIGWHVLGSAPDWAARMVVVVSGLLCVANVCE